jgi:hypothetical protein
MINAEAVSAFGSLRLPWPEYLMEAGELALYMFFACTFATLFHHPASPFGHLIVRAALRRLLTGLALGATAVAIIMSPWGKQSGGHFNPAITLAFYRLGKVDAGMCSSTPPDTSLERLLVSRSRCWCLEVRRVTVLCNTP